MKCWALRRVLRQKSAAMMRPHYHWTRMIVMVAILVALIFVTELFVQTESSSYFRTRSPLPNIDVRSRMTVGRNNATHHETSEAITFIAIGDWGVTVPEQETNLKRHQVTVAKAMNNWAKENGPLDFIVSTGDNFYPRGVDTVASERFEITWSNVYNFGALRDVPWYISLGNHDYMSYSKRGGYPQVARTQLNSTWILPHLWYSKIIRFGNSSLHLIIIDSMALRLRKYQPEQQLLWIASELMTSEAEWKILVAHHPIYCIGLNGPYDTVMLQYLLPMVLKYDVDVILSGHDHALEHIRKVDDTGPHFVISGAGGKEPYDLKHFARSYLKEHNVTVRLYAAENGFVGIKLNDQKMDLEFINEKNHKLYGFSKEKPRIMI